MNTLHTPQVCKEVSGTSRYHYKSWSFEYRCAACGRTGRFNTNYLGQRKVVCNGKRFSKIIKEST